MLEAITRGDMQYSTVVIVVGDNGFSDIHEAFRWYMHCWASISRPATASSFPEYCSKKQNRSHKLLLIRRPVFLAEILGYKTLSLFEDAIEISETGEAAFLRDLGDGRRRVDKQT